MICEDGLLPMIEMVSYWSCSPTTRPPEIKLLTDWGYNTYDYYWRHSTKGIDGNYLKPKFISDFLNTRKDQTSMSLMLLNSASVTTLLERENDLKFMLGVLHIWPISITNLKLTWTSLIKSLPYSLTIQEVCTDWKYVPSLNEQH